MNPKYYLHFENGPGGCWSVRMLDIDGGERELTAPRQDITQALMAAEASLGIKLRINCELAFIKEPRT